MAPRTWAPFLHVAPLAKKRVCCTICALLNLNLKLAFKGLYETFIIGTNGKRTEKHG